MCTEGTERWRSRTATSIETPSNITKLWICKRKKPSPLAQRSFSAERNYSTIYILSHHSRTRALSKMLRTDFVFMRIIVESLSMLHLIRSESRVAFTFSFLWPDSHCPIPST
jgi:hypothetical protein